MEGCSLKLQVVTGLVVSIFNVKNQNGDGSAVHSQEWCPKKVQKKNSTTHSSDGVNSIATLVATGMTETHQNGGQMDPKIIQIIMPPVQLIDTVDKGVFPAFKTKLNVAIHDNRGGAVYRR